MGFMPKAEQEEQEGEIKAYLFRMPSSLWPKLRKFAKKEHRTVRDQLVVIIEKALRDSKEV